jgi:CopG family transcriptional regulator, nickel-responsive regulator
VPVTHRSGSPLRKRRAEQQRHDKIARFKWGKAMRRVTITIDDDLDAELERFMSTRGHDNRSEAIRDLARTGLQQAALEISGPRPCVAALVYVYDHEARELPKRLTRDFHKHHDLAQATLHVHLDEESCMEVTVLKGRGMDVQRFADHIIAERGVRHGHVVYLSPPMGPTHTLKPLSASGLDIDMEHDRFE